MENKNHTRKKWENKNFLKQKNNKQIEEEKELKSQQEIGQPKYLTYRKKRYLGIKLIFYYAAENSHLHQSAI